MKYIFEDLESCENIGQFEEEWVYDVEVDDDNHTFIGNDILVHNSLFVSFKPALDSCDWQGKYDNPLEFIRALDKVKIADYFKDELDKHAKRYGVENKQDFELEKIDESIISLAKKKYIEHVLFEDGIYKDRFSHYIPKGVELVRSSTPLFARDKIINIIEYIFRHPNDFNIKDLLKLIRSIKKEFELCVPDRMDEICMQSSCSKYENMIIDDVHGVKVKKGSHFAVSASAHYNYLLNKNKHLGDKYEKITSGTKIKYYNVKNGDEAPYEKFAYIRGSYPIEFAPEIDIDEQFNACILSPVNSIIEPLGLPHITKRLSVLVDIFGSF